MYFYEVVLCENVVRRIIIIKVYVGIVRTGSRIANVTQYII